ncbi:MAG: hypothetical protein H6R45_776 [Proteobacteria bacterium]|nr:hypothetical protein [Pseudomonadota bacterium]
MADNFPSRAQARVPERRSGRTRVLLGAMLAAFVVGAGLTAYVVASGMFASVSSDVAGMVEDETGEKLTLGGPTPTPSAAQAAAEAVAEQQGGLEARVVGMEQRLDELKLQSQAVSGNAARAEGLLIAFAARRAIERGDKLDYLEGQLKLRFGAAEEDAVKDVIAAARKPVTVEQLLGRLDDLSPKLSSEQQVGWSWFQRELSELFVVRKKSTPSPLPEQRLARARLRLQSGMIDGSIGEVENLPGAGTAQAKAWIADARRYSRAMKALDRIEASAILEPTQLRDSGGKKVVQPSPLGSAKN